MSLIGNLFASVSLLLLVLCPCSAGEKKAKTVPGWGEFIDPAKDCKVHEENGRVTLTVPGTHHNLNPEPEYDNVLGPRLLQPVEGDFQIQVKVLAFTKPGADTSVTKQKLSYLAAGLFIWQDDKTFVRCFRAALGERGDIFVHVEGFHKAKRMPGRVFIKKREERNIPDEAIYLRVSRRGRDLSVERSMDGKDWARFASMSITGFANKLQVGVAAVNSTNKEFTPQLEELKLTK